MSSQLAVMNFFPDVLGRASSLFNSGYAYRYYLSFSKFVLIPPWHRALALKEIQVPSGLNAPILLTHGPSPLSTPKWPTVGQQTGFPWAPTLPLSKTVYLRCRQEKMKEVWSQQSQGTLLLRHELSICRLHCGDGAMDTQNQLWFICQCLQSARGLACPRALCMGIRDHLCSLSFCPPQ